MRRSHFLGVAVVSALLAGAAAGQVPSEDEVTALLAREPVTAATWPAWRQRLLDWIGDRSHATTPAYLAAYDFVRGQADPAGRLTGSLEKDALAWYFLGSSYLRDMKAGDAVDAAAVGRAEAALRESVRFDPAFARAHRNLALALLLKPDNAAAFTELGEARRLAPDLPVTHIRAQAALQLKQFPEAERLFQEALAEEPEEVGYAQSAALAVCINTRRPGNRAADVGRLAGRFPHDGPLACLHGFALAMDGDPKAGTREFDRARQLGSDPAQILSPDVVAAIEDTAAPAWYVRLGWLMLWFAIAYAAVMVAMALAGVVLAAATRGRKALELLGSPAEELVAGGQVRRVGRESLLAKVYVAGLMLGLGLFYVAVPFVVIGLVGLTAGLIMLMFMAPRISIKLVLIVIVVGVGAVWAVLKGLFARPTAGGFGLKKTAADCPRLFDAVGEVAKRVDTSPVDEVYLAPGSEIGVHQEGRGPFGLFGVKRRVLTLGLSTMHYLTVTELKAILAHEYAHFSHADTFVNRFVYQVSLSIGTTLQGMANTGGAANYVNPFYWFLVLYHRSYRLLAAGYSRSREFLADRMAASLYGVAPFRSALSKVCTDGTLFEMTIYQNINDLLGQGKQFINMYAAFRGFRDEQLKADERQAMYDKMLAEEGSLFASHPTFGERVAALEALPAGPPGDDTPARNLFDDPDAVENELTHFLTAYVAHLQRLQAEAARAG